MAPPRTVEAHHFILVQICQRWLSHNIQCHADVAEARLAGFTEPSYGFEISFTIQSGYRSCRYPAWTCWSSSRWRQNQGETSIWILCCRFFNTSIPPLFCGSNRRRLGLASVPCGGKVNRSTFQGRAVQVDVGRIRTIKRHPPFTQYSTRTVNYLSESESETLFAIFSLHGVWIYDMTMRVIERPDGATVAPISSTTGTVTTRHFSIFATMRYINWHLHLHNVFIISISTSTIIIVHRISSFLTTKFMSIWFSNQMLIVQLMSIRATNQRRLIMLMAVRSSNQLIFVGCSYKNITCTKALALHWHYCCSVPLPTHLVDKITIIIIIIIVIKRVILECHRVKLLQEHFTNKTKE